MRGPAQTSEPTIQFLYQLIDSIRDGKLLIPRFQRPLVWAWDRQSELLRSVKDGIPMGAIMLWRTSRDRIKWRDELAGHALPPPPPGVPREYLLDGLQRLSTLFAALRGFGTKSEEDGEPRPPIGYDLEEEVFVESFDPSTQPQIIPLHLLLDSISLLRFQRGLRGDRADIWTQHSDELAKSFREYKVPVISIASEEFEVAVRTFSLINSQGIRMDEADMIHALTWAPDFELRTRMESLRGELLQPVGWGDIGLDTILKVVKAEANLEPVEESAERVSQLLKQDPSTLDRACEHLAQVAEFLRARCGILSWKLVPYSAQVVLLADAFRMTGARADEKRQILDFFVDWFWLTTHGETLTERDGYHLGPDIVHLRTSIFNGFMRWSRTRSHFVRPLPASADFQTPRMKGIALLLARQIRECDPQADDPFQILAEHGWNAMFRLTWPAMVSRDSFFSLGNRFLCAPHVRNQTRLQLFSGQLDVKERIKHLIPDPAIAAAHRDDWDGFVQERARAILEREREFVSAIFDRHSLSE